MKEERDCVLCPLVIPLLPGEQDLSVFQEASSQPVSLRRKAQFFLDQKLYGRARQILELLVELGGRDGELQLTLVSLQILEGNLEQARETLDRMVATPHDQSAKALCYAEIERHQHGVKAAIRYLERQGNDDSATFLKRVMELQVADNK